MAIFGYGCVGATALRCGDRKLALEYGGCRLDYWYADEEASLTTPALQRPRFRILLEHISEGDTLLVAKLYHLGSDAQDISSTVDMLASSGVDVTVMQLDMLNITSPAARTVIATLEAIAEMERNSQAALNRPEPVQSNTEGRKRGRPSSTTQKQRVSIVKRHQAGASISSLARAEELSRASIMRIVKLTSLQ